MLIIEEIVSIAAWIFSLKVQELSCSSNYQYASGKSFAFQPLIGEMYRAFAIGRPREYVDSIVIPRIYCQPL